MRYLSASEIGSASDDAWRGLVKAIRLQRGGKQRNTAQCGEDGTQQFQASCSIIRSSSSLNLLDIPQRTSERRILDAYARAAHDAVEAAFFTQPPSRLSVTLPAFRAGRIDLDVIE